MRQIDSAVLSSLVQFTETMKLPEPSTDIQVKLIETSKRRMRMKAPYCLLICARTGERSWLNVGYAAGQAASFLRFQGISSQIYRAHAEWMLREAPDEGGCAAVLAFGMTETATKAGRESKEERLCIFREAQDDWMEEVLRFAGEHFLLPKSAVRILQKDNRLYLGTRPARGKKAERHQLETGITAAHIMAAADELWIDLELERTEESRMLIGIRRKQSGASVQQTRCTAAAGTLGKLGGKKQRWRYA